MKRGQSSRLGDEEVSDLLRYHLQEKCSWEQLARDEGCDPASLKRAVQEWEHGSCIVIRGGKASVVYPAPEHIDPDALREEVEAEGLTDEEIAHRHGVRVSVVVRRRRELGLLRAPTPAAKAPPPAQSKEPAPPKPKRSGGAYAWMSGDMGELMRGAAAFEEKMEAKRLESVERKVSVPCASCRLETAVSSLKGRPGRLVCAACEDKDRTAAPPSEEWRQGMGRKATEEERDERRGRVLALTKAGLNQKQIAEELNASQATVSADVRWWESQGEAPRRAAEEAGDDRASRNEKILDALESGSTAAEVAAALQLTPDTVRRAARNARTARALRAADPKVQNAEVEALREEVERLRAALEFNPWRRAWEAQEAHRLALHEEERARLLLEKALAELESVEAALAGEGGGR